MTLSRNSGRVKFIENGIKIVADKYYDDIIEWMKIIPETVIFFIFIALSLIFFMYQATLFTFGCFYRNQVVKYMSMYGSVTDAQIFSRELTDEEMIDITSCRYWLKS